MTETPAAEPLARHHRVARVASRRTRPRRGRRLLLSARAQARRRRRLHRRPHPRCGALRRRRRVRSRAEPAAHAAVGRDRSRAKVGALGIGDGDTIVIYDGLGMFSSPRVWWTFRLFGAEKVFILEGGMPKWQAERRPIEAGLVTRPPRKFTARMNAGIVAALPKIQSVLADKSAQVVDARPADRFRGDAPEPRPGVRPGPYPRIAQRALHRAGEGRKAPARRRAAQGLRRRRRRHRAADHHQLRLRASRRRPCGSRSTRSARSRRRSTTAHGRNGDRATTCRRRPGRSRRPSASGATVASLTK